MKNIIGSILDKQSIEYFGIIPFSSCKVINKDLLDRTINTWTPQSVIMFIAPYYSGEHKERNLSLYAVPKDYHLFFKQMYAAVLPQLKMNFPDNNFTAFADHSPIGETYAASMAGLGVVGDKFQLINEKYGSHVFIGEIITDLGFDSYDESEVQFCEHCGLCSSSCPSKDYCFSEITQRKGDLAPEEEQMIIDQNCVWGCDVCRTVCPHNSNISVTPIEFFKTDLITNLSEEIVEGMTKDEFKSRAFGWKGKKTIIRNIRILNK